MGLGNTHDSHSSNKHLLYARHYAKHFVCDCLIFIPTRNLRYRDHIPHFTGEETEVQRSEVTCSVSE